jgi:transcriptional regulator with XRE-family HTH domain
MEQAKLNKRSKVNINEKIGRLIRQRRKELCLTQRDLADKLDVSAQQIQKYEKGVNVLNLQRLLEINEALVIPPTYLFLEATYKPASRLNEDGEQFIKTAASSPISVQEVDNFLHNFFSLKTESQRSIIVLVNDLANRSNDGNCGKTVDGSCGKAVEGNRGKAVEGNRDKAVGKGLGIDRRQKTKSPAKPTKITSRRKKS